MEHIVQHSTIKNILEEWKVHLLVYRFVHRFYQEIKEQDCKLKFVFALQARSVNVDKEALFLHQFYIFGHCSPYEKC